jgi:RNA polymerase sigma factor (sigma-70 family)
MSYTCPSQTTNFMRQTKTILQAEEMNSYELRAELEKHQREGYGWALSCCGRNPVEAENVLQTVYLKALQGKARFDGRASFKTWLFAVIRRTAIDERRRQWLRWLRMDKYEESIKYTASGESPDEAIYRSEIRASFRRALRALPRRQREVLQLVFYHDLSLTEAAEVMEVSLGSARTHYERGKQRLRRLMKGVEISDEAGRGENQKAVSTTARRR